MRGMAAGHAGKAVATRTWQPALKAAGRFTECGPEETGFQGPGSLCGAAPLLALSRSQCTRAAASPRSYRWFCAVTAVAAARRFA